MARAIMTPEPKKRRWTGWRGIALVVSLPVLLGIVFVVKARRDIPAGMVRDIRAGVAARGIADPDKRIARYLELRYGPLSDPANRRKAFLDFFNVDHVRALQLMVKHSPAEHRQGNIEAMAKWVEDYREKLTNEEREILKTQFQTPDGRAMLRQATAQYNSQDVHYRGTTAPVISQLLRTISSVQSE